MALDVEEVAALVDGEWSAFVDLLEDDRAGWDGATRLSGWRVEELARHTHWGMTLEARGLALSATSGPGRAAGRHMTGPVEELPAALRVARGELVEAIRSLPAGHSSPVPMPYGDVPLDLALQIFVMEAAMHRSDLAHAVTGDVVLTTAAVPAAAAVLQTYWAAWAAAATTSPPAGTAIRLSGDAALVEAQFDGSGWGPLTAEPSVVVSGSGQSLMLYAYGRLPFEAAGLTVSGDRDIASRLKEWVPGP